MPSHRPLRRPKTDRTNEDYRDLDDSTIAELVTDHGTLADLKVIWRDRRIVRALDYWTL